MNRFEQDHLLHEVLNEDGLSALRQASLERGLLSMRRKRARRFTGNVLAAAVLVALIFGFLAHRTPSKNASVPRTAPVPQTIAGVKVISDEELFALFPNRSMALIGKPGRQQLLFFGQTGQ